jgi:hypothetical protein
MATLKQMLDPVAREKVYDLKDALKRDRVLSHDPMRLNRTRFELYLTAKAEALITDGLSAGDHPNKVFHATQLQLKVIDAQWREEAKRLATHQAS